MTDLTTAQPVTFRPCWPTPRARLRRWAEKSLALKVPMVNRVAVDYPLTRDYETDAFMAMLMADEAFGTYKDYVLTRTTFFEHMGSV